MQVAVVGLGVMGQLHARVLNELGALHGVYDIDHERVQSVATKYNVKEYHGIQHILDDATVSAVTIAAPTPTHMELSIRFLMHNKHVLLEKPIASTVKEAELILPHTNGLVFSVGYIERYNPAFKNLWSIINSEELGDITSINIKRIGGIPRSADNVVLDLMTHDIDLLMSIFQREPLKVSSHKSTRDGIIDSAQVLLDFGSASATCEANWVSPIKVRTIQVTGTKKYCEVDLIRQTVTQYSNNTEYKQRFNEEPLKAEMQAFLNAIRGSTDYVTGDQAIKVLKWTLKANEN
jgi:UDP-N-acetylglucosamine 3-dehydrogenase